MLSSVMGVNLEESTHEDRIKIQRMNSNATQAIDTTQLTEWAFEIQPLDFGEIDLNVSVSAMRKTEFGDKPFDLPVKTKRIKVFATNTDKLALYWHRYTWAFVLVGLFLIYLLYKLYQNLKKALKDKALKNGLSIKSIDDFIKEGNIVVVLELALKKNDITPEDKTYFTVQLARLNKLETDKRIGIIDDNAYRIAYNQIMNAVIQKMQ